MGGGGSIWAAYNFLYVKIQFVLESSSVTNVSVIGNAFYFIAIFPHAVPRFITESAFDYIHFMSQLPKITLERRSGDVSITVKNKSHLVWEFTHRACSFRKLFERNIYITEK